MRRSSCCSRSCLEGPRPFEAVIVPGVVAACGSWHIPNVTPTQTPAPLSETHRKPTLCIRVLAAENRPIARYIAIQKIPSGTFSV